MLKKTQGIVVSYLRYRETSVIVKVFTRELGLKSYIVNGVRSSSSKSKMALYQPLTLLDLVVYDKDQVGLNRISEVKLSMAFQRIPFDFYRSGIAMFLAEVMSKCIYDSYQNPDLFDFLHAAIEHLDQDGVSTSHFPLAFLLEISKYLGFAPDDPESFFNELNADLPRNEGPEEEMAYLTLLLEESFNLEAKISGICRRNLLDYFLVFFSKHLENSSEWKSVKVLRQLLA